MIKLESICAAALLALTLGCGRMTADHVVTGPSVAPYRGHVQIAMEGQPIPPEFTEIGLVRARGEGNQANLEAVLGGLEEEARLVGANAVVRVRIDQGSGSVSAIGTAGIVQ